VVVAEPDTGSDGGGQPLHALEAELEATLEVALADARRQLSLIRGSLASVTAFLTRPEQ